MIYSIDTVTAKIFFKIQETGNLRLLVTKEDKISFNQLEVLWEIIINEYNIRSGNKRKDKAFNIIKKIEGLSNKYGTLLKSLTYLFYKRDNELESIVSSYNYKLSEESFKEDVEKNLKLISSIHNRIKKYEQDLEELKPKEGQYSTFEETLIAFYVILGVTVKDANTITLLEFLALEKQVKEKVIALEKQTVNGR